MQGLTNNLTYMRGSAVADSDSIPSERPNKRVRDSAKEYAAQKDYQAAYRAANKTRIAEYAKQYVAATLEARRAYRRAYYKANEERIKQYRDTDEWRAATLARALAWQKENSDRVNANHRAYGKANPHIGRAKTAHRNAAKTQRTPVWFGEVDALVMVEAAHLAALRSKAFGFAWDVDHILPLKGETVHGLHVWNNIQVIPATVNRSKGNTVSPEMLA